MKVLSPRFASIAAVLCISLLFSCSPDNDDHHRSPPPSSSSNEEIGGLSSSSLPAGTVLCLFQGNCAPVNSETCSLIGQAVQSCSVPSSSSSLPSNMVLCLYSGGCIPIATETCSLIGQIVQNCPTATASSSSAAANNAVLCLYSGGCIPLAPETCSLIGQQVQSCPTPPTPSSSSSLPSGTVLCLYSGGCIAITPETCTILSGQTVQNCPAVPSSSSAALQPNSSNSARSSSSLGNSSSPSSSSNSVVVSPSSQSGGTIVTPGTGGPVSYYGELKASGNKIVGSKTGSTAVQVRGVSLFWSNTGWGGDRFFTAAAVNAMVDGWKAEIVRVPIGYAEDDGYSTDPSNLTRVKTAIDAAIAKGVYVIIDWHSHNAHNEQSAANSFFSSMAQTYGSIDNVIFEIYNEPKCSNGDVDGTCPGGYTTWAQIKTYATSIISTIRQYSDNLILVGTPKWDQNVNDAVSSPLADNNVAYVFHFYAAEHPLAYFQSNIDAVLSASKPVFVSEYGTVMADGNGSHSASNTDAWHTYMDGKKISSCAWSVNDKNESASFFKPSFNMSNWTTTSSMNASGQYIYNKLTTYASSAVWRGGSGNGSSSGSGSEDYGMSCGGYCYWSESGCVEIRTDPDALYGTTRITTCTAAISNCSSYGNGPYTNSSCGGGNVVISSSSSGSGTSSTRCKDGLERDYFCEWTTGCFAIDPTYSDPPGRTCNVLVTECRNYGLLYVNSSTEGEDLSCHGTYVGN